MLRLFSALILATCASLATADVIVLDNRSRNDVTVKITPVTSVPFNVRINSGDIMPVFVDGKAHASFTTRREQKNYLLNADSAYFFGNTAGGNIALQEIGLGGNTSTANGRSLPGSVNASPVTIPVKIVVDEEEPAIQAIWEKKLRRRIEKASAIFDKHCRLRLKVVAVERWNSENAENDFFKSLAEFEKEVKPFPAQLAIGFTSQYHMVRGRVHLGGTRGLFHSHILVREWSKHVGEPERLELLVHEIGHFLGAVHSPEPGSVMRPVVGDKKAIRNDFRIRFDPVNTLAMAMIVEEMRRRSIRKSSDLTQGTSRRLAQVFGSLTGNAPPQAALAGRQPNARKPNAEPATTPMIAAVRKVLRGIVSAARDNHKLSTNDPSAAKSGDMLTELYVRSAATAAEKLPDEIAARAFIVGLGVGLDESSFLRKLPKTKELVTMIEPAGQRSVRIAFLGKPTMSQRNDLLQHFLVSAFLTAIQDRETAEAAGLAKELVDSRGSGTGFSFADLAADKAGAKFGDEIGKGHITLAELADNFTVASFLPQVDDLPEGIRFKDLIAQFGSNTDDARFQAQLQTITKRLDSLPGYSNASSEPEALAPDESSQ